MSSFPNLDTDRLELRQIRSDDLDLIYKGLSHPEVIRFYGVQFATRNDTKEQMQWYRDLEASAKGIWWAICSKNGAFLGAAGFNEVDDANQKCEVGFWLLPEHWGQGIVREVLAAILPYAFTTMKMHRIEAYVETQNVNSKRVLEKCGFEQEGTLRECEVKEGERISLDLFALLNK